MKIRNLALGIVVVLAATYGAATFYFSSQAKASAAEWSQKLAQRVPALRVANEEYRRGFLKSTHEITFEFPQLPVAGAKAPSVTLRNVIEHGPLPGFSAPGLARIEHSLVFDETIAKELSAAFGDQAPIKATTLIDFSGGGSTELKGGAATYKSGDFSLSWQGLAGTVRFAKDVASYSAEIAAPGLTLSGKESFNGSLKALTLKTDQAKLANTETLYLGTFSMGVESVAVAKDGKPVFELKNLSLNSEASSKDNEFVDVTARALVAEFRGDAFSGSKAEYAFSARHLHAQSLDQIAKAMRAANQQMQNVRAAPLAEAEAARAAALGVVMTHGMALLQREPVIAIERIGFVSKEGETKISGSARLAGVTAADSQSPLNLIAKVQAEASIAVPEAIVASAMADTRLKAMKAPGRETGAEESAQLAAQAKLEFDQQLAQFVQLGFVKRDNGILSAKIVFKGGELTINDKPFDPMAAASLQPDKIAPGR
jgi:uncharacterized protein YdgA (DUF945 family)